MFGITITAVAVRKPFHASRADKSARSTTSAVVFSIFLVQRVDRFSPRSSFSGRSIAGAAAAQSALSTNRCLQRSRCAISGAAYWIAKFILHGVSFDVQQEKRCHSRRFRLRQKHTAPDSRRTRRPTSVEIWIKGKNWPPVSADELDSSAPLACRFGRSALRVHAVGENVALPLREHTKLEDPTIESCFRLNSISRSFRYEDYVPSQLSGGMKKARQPSARALAMDPEFFFSTHLPAGLDPIIAAGIDGSFSNFKQPFP